MPSLKRSRRVKLFSSLRRRLTSESNCTSRGLNIFKPRSSFTTLRIVLGEISRSLAIPRILRCGFLRILSRTIFLTSEVRADLHRSSTSPPILETTSFTETFDSAINAPFLHREPLNYFLRFHSSIIKFQIAPLFTFLLIIQYTKRIFG